MGERTGGVAAVVAAVAALLLSAATARAQDALTVTSPHGGELWLVGSTQQITWVGPTGGNVSIELSRDDGATFEWLFTNRPNDGAAEWTVDGPTSTTCQVRITLLSDTMVTATSAADFSIVDSITGLTVTSPNGGDSWIVGTQQVITWSDDAGGDVQIELSRDGGVRYETLFDRTRNDGAETWTVAGDLSGTCLVRITRLDGSGVSDQSNGLFTITDTARLEVTAPNGDELWTVGSRQLIQWQGLHGGRAVIELSRDAGATWETLFSNTADDGIQPWIVTGAPSGQCLIRVTRLTSPTLSDVSDALFSIADEPLAVAAPRGGENWVIGTQQVIRWTAVAGGTVTVELTRDGGTTWQTLYADSPNDGEQFWTVTGPPSANAFVRITRVENGSITDTDTSDTAFTISRGTLQVTSPNGGERLAAGSAAPLLWTTTAAGTVRAELTRDGGATWQTVLVNTANDGSDTWTVPGPPSSTCRIRLTSWQDASLTDESDADFAIFCAPRTFAITAGQDLTGSLGAGDCDAPDRPGSRAQLYTFTMPADGLVTITLQSTAFDVYVLLLAADGHVIHENDDFPPGTDARLDSVDLPAGGPYTIEVTAKAGGLGPYQVGLQRFDIHLASPRGGEVWRFGERHTIAWASGAPHVPVDLLLSRAGGASAASEVIAARTANDGSEAWTVTGPATTNAVFQACIPYGSRGTSICDASLPVTLEPCTPGSTHTCYDGPEGTLGVGVCRAGMQLCGSDGVFGECHGAVEPATDICGDGIDQDCSGADAQCVPCPNHGNCADDDPCTVDTCIAGVCHNDRPAPWTLLDCRSAALSQALDAMTVGCEKAAPPAVLSRYRRRIGRLFTAVERLVQRAHATSDVRRCVARLVRARLKAIRLGELIGAAGARQALCQADPVLLDRRVGDVGAAILSVSSCRP